MFVRLVLPVLDAECSLSLIVYHFSNYLLFKSHEKSCDYSMGL